MKLRSALNRAMLALFVGLVTLFWLLQYVLPVLVIYQHVYILVFAFVCGMITLLTVYPAVALKLYRQGRAIRPSNSRVSVAIKLQSAAVSVARGTAAGQVRGAVAATANAVPTSRTAEAASLAAATQTQNKVAGAARRAMHVQAMKIYTSLFIVLLISFWRLVAAA